MKIKKLTVTGDLSNLKKIEVTGYYELLEDVSVVIEFEDMDTIIAKGLKGYYFDFASIPTFLEWFLEPNHEMVILASFVHDICCHWKYVNVKFSAKLMQQLMKWYIKHNVKSIRTRIKYKFKSTIVFLALYFSNTASTLFRDTALTDVRNKKYSSII